MIGLRPFADKIADAVDDAARARTSALARRNRVIAGAERVLLDAYLAGMERAIIAVRNDPAAVAAFNAILADMMMLANELSADDWARVAIRVRELRGAKL